MKVSRQGIASLIALLVAGGLLYPLLTAPKKVEEPNSGRRVAGALGMPTPVLVAPARIADVPIYLEAIGTARPLNTAVVRAQVDGKLLKLHFKDGQDVKKGDLLAQIDPVLFQAQFDQVSAKKMQNEVLLATARRDLERFIKLAESNTGSRVQVDNQRANVASLEAQLKGDAANIDAARATLDFATIRAPIDGRAGLRNVDEGNLIRSSDSNGLVSIIQISPISILFSIPQQSLSRVQAAQTAGTVKVETLASEGRSPETGTLTAIDNQVDTTTGSIRLKAEFPNTKQTLWPGAFVNVRVLVETLTKVVTIPASAVQRGPNGTFVYALSEGNTARIRNVTLKSQDAKVAVVSTGLTEGEKIIVSGFARVEDGVKVAPTDAKDTDLPRDPATPQADIRPAAESPQAAPGERRGERRRRNAGEPGSESGAAPKGPPNVSPNAPPRAQQ